MIKYLFVYLSIILFACNSKEESSNVSEDIVDNSQSEWKAIKNSPIPKGRFPRGRDGFLWEPLFNIKYYYENKSDTVYMPSVTLYYYPKSDSLKLKQSIKDASLMSWCIPIEFCESKDYIVITTPCDLHPKVAEVNQEKFNKFVKSLKVMVQTNNFINMQM